MRLGEVETCRLTQLTSGSTGFKPQSFRLQCPCSFCCLHATFTFIALFNVCLLDTRGTIYRVCTALEAEFAVRESPQKTHWEGGIQPCSSTACTCGIMISTHRLSPMASLLVVSGDPGSACQMLAGSLLTLLSLVLFL